MHSYVFSWLPMYSYASCGWRGDAITVKPAGGILGWIDGRLGVTVVLFIWWNGMCMELGGEFHDALQRQF